MPDEIQYDANATPPQFTNNADMTIEPGTHVRVKIIGLRTEVGEMWAIGSINGDFLGFVLPKHRTIFRFVLTYFVAASRHRVDLRLMESNAVCEDRRRSGPEANSQMDAHRAKLHHPMFLGNVLPSQRSSIPYRISTSSWQDVTTCFYIGPVQPKPMVLLAHHIQHFPVLGLRV